MKYTKITIRINTQHKPPFFIGSALRGAFGYALKKITCINPQYVCDGCFAKESCLYYEFYEEKNSFHKYRFDFRLAMEQYEFDYYLFDDATSKLPYIISSFIKMLKDYGLGKDGVKFDDFDIYINDILATNGSEIKLPKEYVKVFKIDEIYSDVYLELITPLRIKKENRFLRTDDIELSDIVNSTYQRQMRLLGRGFKKFPYQIKGEIVEKNLKYQELTRSSNRQKTLMNLGGIMGNMTIRNLNKESFEVLKLAELLAVGKQSVFGLGKIKINKKDL
ncbi:MAG: CRISPR system precrRNA processing endoribonuclease RAMP protein Cas6 [Arcobacteraceae bacterium]|jgi:hypothetical protein|nr:CRISPR system precrRNA processing endoribonuclease RAMP protein Cas6 [Arcobacteraceae bacterium]